MREALFHNQQDLGLSGLSQRASDLGLDRTTFDSCVTAGAADHIRSDIGGAVLVGVSATPTLLIGRIRTDGRVQVTRRIVGAVPVRVLQDILDELLRSTPGS
jgi:predicted DsbA family dithiol-disulfide isomerase